MRLTPEGHQAPQQDSLQARLESEAAVWVDLMVKTLESEGRIIEGGWPGTVSEARSRVVNCLAMTPDGPVAGEEMTVRTDTLYREAKRLWQFQRS